MLDDALVSEAKRVIDALAATPRFAGSSEERKARMYCAELLKGAGLATRELPFDFSQWPGRYGIPLIAGAILTVILAMAATALFTTWAHPTYIGIWLIVIGHQIHFRKRNTATRDLSWRVSPSSNLEATRGEPRVWLVAHLDSKSQSIPMLVRVGSHFALYTVLFFAFVLAFLASFGWIQATHWGWIAVAGAIAALPSLFCFVGNKSPGALDNATGVAAVLLAARLVPAEKSFGVLITSGEELDLAGARAWSAAAHKGAMMINCDTIDDNGAFRCMFMNRPHALGVAAERAAKKLGLALRMGKVIPGIITDSMAFEAAGLPSVTLSRGTLQTLARLHTSGDSPDRVTGAGAATAASLLAQMVEELA